jgi:hypothetical protein
MYAAVVSSVHLTTYVCVLTTVYHFCCQSQVTMEVLVFVIDESGCPSPTYNGCILDSVQLVGSTLKAMHSVTA